MFLKSIGSNVGDHRLVSPYRAHQKALTSFLRFVGYLTSGLPTVWSLLVSREYLSYKSYQNIR